MNKKLLLVLLFLTGCVSENNNTQDMLIAIHECEIAELRAVGLHNSEGEFFIQCCPYKDE